jgi:hypothetical protein
MESRPWILAILAACACDDRSGPSGVELDADLDARVANPGEAGAGLDASGPSDAAPGLDATLTHDSLPGDGSSISEASVDAAGPADAAGGAAPGDAGPLRCASARWSNVSPACWSCWCAACGDTLNETTPRSQEIFACMFEKDLLVNSLFELSCEVRAGQAECAPDGGSDWDKLVSFDTCLIFSLGAANDFRVCDTECGVSYTGDVCTRYP